ncbi:MAG TPA: L-threonylcarbamoyladenylate synthase [Methanobacteriaceae archaeon]|nr:L-threonylcarbamoyladenylate synthase [Methanobacteriaceae archaeon]
MDSNDYDVQVKKIASHEPHKEIINKLALIIDSMKIIKINPEQPDNIEITKAREALREGKVIVYPTDTLYGIGANIFNEEAVKRVYRIKKRSEDRPLSICLSRVMDLERVADLDDKSLQLAIKLLPGPYTLILKKNKQISNLITAGSDKIGVRIPDNSICRVLTMEFPITTTSANLSGEETPCSVEELTEQFKDEVDIYLDAGDPSQLSPSTVLDLTSWPPKILRRGAWIEKVQKYLD